MAHGNKKHAAGRNQSVFSTRGGKNYLDHLLSLNPSKDTIEAIERVKRETRSERDRPAK
jgi:hypothetical protein